MIQFDEHIFQWVAQRPSRYLGGAFRYCLFSSLLGEDSHFDEHIIQMGWNCVNLISAHPYHRAYSLPDYLLWHDACTLRAVHITFHRNHQLDILFPLWHVLNSIFPSFPKLLGWLKICSGKLCLEDHPRTGKVVRITLIYKPWNGMAICKGSHNPMFFRGRKRSPWLRSPLNHPLGWPSKWGENWKKVTITSMVLGACPNSWHPTKSRGILRARRVSSCFWSFLIFLNVRWCS